MNDTFYRKLAIVAACLFLFKCGMSIINEPPPFQDPTRESCFDAPYGEADC